MDDQDLTIDDILSLPNVSLSTKWQLPEIQGIYFIVSLPRTVLYIGHSKNLLKRFNGHDKIRKFNKYTDPINPEDCSSRIFYLDCEHLSTSELIKAESSYIFRYNPKNNTVGTFKNIIQNYAQQFFRLFNTLKLFYEKPQIIKYINSNIYRSNHEYHSSYSIENKIKLVNYQITKRQSVITYGFDFQISSDIDCNRFKEIFLEVGRSRHFIGELFIVEEQQKLIFELKISIHNN